MWGFLIEMAPIPVEEAAVLLLHLFIQEPVMSTLLKQIMNRVFGLSSSAILYRIFQVREFRWRQYLLESY